MELFSIRFIEKLLTIFAGLFILYSSLKKCLFYIQKDRKMTSTTATETAQSGEEQKTQSPTKETGEQPKQDGDEQKTEDTKTDELTKEKLDAKPSSPSKLMTLLPTKGPVHKMEYDKDVVYLYQFSRCPTIPSISPFCLKVETWLRLTGIKYEVSSLKCKFTSPTPNISSTCGYLQAQRARCLS